MKIFHFKDMFKTNINIYTHEEFLKIYFQGIKDKKCNKQIARDIKMPYFKFKNRIYYLRFLLKKHGIFLPKNNNAIRQKLDLERLSVLVKDNQEL